MADQVPKGGRGKAAFLFTLTLGLGDLAVLNFVLAPKYQEQEARRLASARTAEVVRSAAASDSVVRTAPDHVGQRVEPTQATAEPAEEVEEPQEALEDTGPGAETEGDEPSDIADPKVTKTVPTNDGQVNKEVTPKTVDKGTASAPVQEDRTGTVPKASAVYFASGTGLLSPATRNTLVSVVAQAKKQPSYTIEVLGHADQRGDAQSNLLLSKRRANAVAQFLMARGVLRRRIHIRPLGEDQPQALGEDEATLAKNRRVEIRWHKGDVKE